MMAMPIGIITPSRNQMRFIMMSGAYRRGGGQQYPFFCEFSKIRKNDPREAFHALTSLLSRDRDSTY